MIGFGKNLWMLLWLALPAYGSPLTAKEPMIEPKDFIEHYQAALSTQSWIKVAPLIHERCTVTFSNGTCHRGKDAVCTAFERNFELIESEEYSISGVHWIVTSEDFAVFAFTYKWAGAISGKRTSGEGRGTSSIVRGESGNWQLVSEHLGPSD